MGHPPAKVFVSCLITLALGVWSPGGLSAQESVSQRTSNKALAAVPSLSDGVGTRGITSPEQTERPAFDRLYAGDTLQIRFMETIDIPDPRAAMPVSKGSGLVRTFYQRADLSGEYHIRPDGFINLPIIGAVPAAKMTLEQFEELLRSKIESTIDRKLQISIGITQREPIYVIGGVRNAGSFPYRSGMMVVHAIALAGGIEKSITGMDRSLQLVRHRNLVQKARNDLKSYLAVKARLEAERDGQETIKIPQRLVELVGSSMAKEMIEIESQIMRTRAKRHASRVTTIEDEISARRRELELLKAREEKFVSQVASRRLRAQNMQRLSERADTTNDRVLALQRDLLDSEAQQSDYAIAVMNSEQRLQIRSNDLVKLQLDHEGSIEADLAKVNAEISEAEQALATNLAIVALFSNGPQEDLTPSFTVIRKQDGQPLSVAVAATAFLEPGDLLRVEAETDRGTNERSTAER